jgi:hypothetical protein
MALKVIFMINHRERNINVVNVSNDAAIWTISASLHTISSGLHRLKSWPRNSMALKVIFMINHRKSIIYVANAKNNGAIWTISAHFRSCLLQLHLLKSCPRNSMILKVIFIINRQINNINVANASNTGAIRTVYVAFGGLIKATCG